MRTALGVYRRGIGKNRLLGPPEPDGLVARWAKLNPPEMFTDGSYDVDQFYTYCEEGYTLASEIAKNWARVALEVEGTSKDTAVEYLTWWTATALTLRPYGEFRKTNETLADKWKETGQ